MAFAAVLRTPSAAAAPLLARTGSAAIAGVARVQRLALDRRALSALRAQDEAEVAAFPLGEGRTVDLVLRRFEPFADGIRVEVVEASGSRTLALPDRVYFTGTVAGEGDSLVFLAAGRDRVHGFVVSGGDVHPFGPDGHGGHRIYSVRDADPTVYPPPGDFCANDLHPEEVALPAAVAALAEPAPPIAATTTLKRADVAIESDYELRAKFATDTDALNYLSSLAAAATAIYERDVAVRLNFSYIRLWATSADPWTATSTTAALDELRAYWNDPANNMAAIAGPRTTVHFISGKSVQGGVAYVNVLCNASYGYGVSQVYGAFDLSQPSQIWDVEVVTHELGHNFGSPHTHCYSPPVDECYNQEAGCYSGPVVASRGTIMSYCHLLAGGLANIDLLFGSVVSDRIGQSVSAATCLATVGTTTTTTTAPTTTTTTVTTSTSTTTTVTTSTSTTVTTSTATTSTSSTTSSTSTTTTLTTSTTTSTTSSTTSSTTTSTVTTSSTTSTSTLTTSTSTTTTVTTSTATTSTSSTTSSTSTTTTVTTSSTTSTLTTSTTTSTTSTATTSTSTTTFVTTSTTTTLAPTTTSSTTTVRPTSTTSTTVLSIASADDDGDGVPNGLDACAGTARGDLVDARGCSVCPCDGPAGGGTWIGRGQYVRCVRSEARRRVAAGLLDAGHRRAALDRARRSTCGRPDPTRCCLYTGATDTVGRCRITRRTACESRIAGGNAADAGPGSCLPSPCAR